MPGKPTRQRSAELGYMLAFAGLFCGSIGAYFLANSPNVPAAVFSIVFITVSLVIGLAGIWMMHSRAKEGSDGE